MFRYTRKLPSFATVGAGQMATLMVPKGWTYRGLVLKYQTGGANATEAQMKADLTAIRLKVNGNTRYEASAEQLIDIQTHFYGESVVAGMLFIPLSRKWLKTIEAQDNTAWGTSNVDTFSIEVDISGGAVTPSLVAHAEVDPVKNDLGIIVEGHTFHYNAAGAGTMEISDLPKSSGQLVGLHMKTTVVSALQLTVNAVEFINSDIDVMNAIYQREPMRRAPVNGWVHLDPLALNRIGDAWPMAVEDFRLKLTTTGAGTVDLFLETLSAPLGLPTTKK